MSQLKWHLTIIVQRGVFCLHLRAVWPWLGELFVWSYFVCHVSKRRLIPALGPCTVVPFPVFLAVVQAEEELWEAAEETTKRSQQGTRRGPVWNEPADQEAGGMEWKNKCWLESVCINWLSGCWVHWVSYAADLRLNKRKKVVQGLINYVSGMNCSVVVISLLWGEESYMSNNFSTLSHLLIFLLCWAQPHSIFFCCTLKMWLTNTSDWCSVQFLKQRLALKFCSSYLPS